MVYLAADAPRWEPTSQQDLGDAVASGLLEETHHLELKRELGTGPKANKELARDLAQFAVDGGAVIIGVEERHDGPAVLHPLPLDGLPERIEQIARMNCDPPLPVTVRSIASDEPGRGYLVIEVPSTGTAPHMVDGSYFGRGEKTKQRLSDAEVVRLHQARANLEEAAGHVLDTYLQRDPVPEDARCNAHLFVVLAPISPRREMALNLVASDGWQERLLAIREAGRRPHLVLGADRFAPDIGYATNFARRADGVALSFGLTSDRRLEDLGEAGRRRSERVFEIELSEEGALRVMTARFSDTTDRDDPAEQVIFVNMMPILVRRSISMAVAVADQCGYQGGWLAGIGATGLNGQTGWAGPTWYHDYPSKLSRDQADYRMTTTASLAELIQMPGSVTRTLTGRFLRSLGQEDACADWLRDPDPRAIAQGDSG